VTENFDLRMTLSFKVDQQCQGERAHNTLCLARLPCVQNSFGRVVMQQASVTLSATLYNFIGFL